MVLGTDKSVQVEVAGECVKKHFFGLMHIFQFNTGTPYHIIYICLLYFSICLNEITFYN